MNDIAKKPIERRIAATSIVLQKEGFRVPSCVSSLPRKSEPKQSTIHDSRNTSILRLISMSISENHTNPE